MDSRGRSETENGNRLWQHIRRKGKISVRLFCLPEGIFPGKETVGLAKTCFDGHESIKCDKILIMPIVEKENLFGITRFIKFFCLLFLYIKSVSTLVYSIG